MGMSLCRGLQKTRTDSHAVVWLQKTKLQGANSMENGNVLSRVISQKLLATNYSIFSFQVLGFQTATTKWISFSDGKRTHKNDFHFIKPPRPPPAVFHNGWFLTCLRNYQENARRELLLPDQESSLWLCNPSFCQQGGRWFFLIRPIHCGLSPDSNIFGEILF